MALDLSCIISINKLDYEMLNWSSPSLEYWKSLHSARDHIFWASPFLRKVGFKPDVSIGDVSIGFQI